MITSKTDYVKEIITDVSKLGNRCVEIDPRKEGKELSEIVLSLKQTMKENNLVSLSAPQIGFDKRVCCFKFGDNDYRTLVNPMIEHVENLTFAREKCTSIPDKEFIRPRYAKIRVIYMTPMGKVESREVVGKAAIVIQHSIEHLDGLLLSDVALEIDERYDQATDEEREEVLRMYAESLDLREQELKKEIENDEELSKISSAIDFMTKVQKGEVEIEQEVIRKENNKEENKTE